MKKDYFIGGLALLMASIYQIVTGEVIDPNVIGDLQKDTNPLFFWFSTILEFGLGALLIIASFESKNKRAESIINNINNRELLKNKGKKLKGPE